MSCGHDPKSEALTLKHRARLILEYFDFLPTSDIVQLERRTTYLHVLKVMCVM